MKQVSYRVSSRCGQEKCINLPVHLFMITIVNQILMVCFYCYSSSASIVNQKYENNAESSETWNQCLLSFREVILLNLNIKTFLIDLCLLSSHCIKCTNCFCIYYVSKFLSEILPVPTEDEDVDKSNLVFKWSERAVKRIRNCCNRWKCITRNY